MTKSDRDHETTRSEIDTVFAAMGSALTRWSMVDSALTIVYGVAVNPRKPRAGAASIWRITSVNQKLELIDAALKAMCSDYPKSEPTQVKECWKAARKAVVKAAAGRNELAHSSLHASVIGAERKSILQRDRERFYKKMEGCASADFHDAETCRRVEHDAFDAVISVVKLLQALDEFFRQSRIRMNEDDAHHAPAF